MHPFLPGSQSDNSKVNSVSTCFKHPKTARSLDASQSGTRPRSLLDHCLGTSVSTFSCFANIFQLLVALYPSYFQKNITGWYEPSLGKFSQYLNVNACWHYSHINNTDSALLHAKSFDALHHSPCIVLYPLTLSFILFKNHI